MRLEHEFRGPGVHSGYHVADMLYHHCLMLKSLVYKGELEHRIPRLHSPVNSRRFLDSFGDFRNNETVFLRVFVENCFLPFAPVDLRRKPEPVPLPAKW